MTEKPIFITDIYFEVEKKVDSSIEHERRSFGYYKEAGHIVMMLKGDKSVAQKLKEVKGFDVLYIEPEITVRKRINENGRISNPYDAVFPLIEAVITKLNLPIPVEISADVVRGGSSGHRGGSMAQIVIHPFPAGSVLGVREYGVELLKQALGMPKGAFSSNITIDSEPNLAVEVAERLKIEMFRDVNLKLKNAHNGITFDVSEARTRD